MISFLISVLGVNFLTNVYKKLQSRYGDTRIHIFAFLVSVLAAFAVTYFGSNPTFIHAVKYAGEVFTSAIALYQIFFRQLGKVIQLPSIDASS